MPPAITWQTVEDAIHTWVSGLSGVPGNCCIWPYQGGATPPKPYIALAIDAARGVGQPWKRKSYDPVEDELVVKVISHQVATLEIQFFGVKAGTPGTTGREPLEKLSDVVAGIDLYEQELDDGGVGIGDITPVQFVDPKGAILEGRAVVTVQLHLMAELEKREDYVATWTAKVHPQDPAGDDLAEIEVTGEL